MNNDSGGLTCVITCWLIALLGGLLLAALLMMMAGFSFIAATFFGLVVLVLGGIGLSWAFCKKLPGPNEVSIDHASDHAKAGHAKPGHETMQAASAHGSGAAAEAAPVAAVAGTAAASAATAAGIQPSAKLAGEEELAGRKGEWKYDGSGSGSDADAAKAKADADAAAARAEADAKARAEADAAAKAEADAKASSVDYDGDGIQEGANEGTRPEALDGPRDGKADDLKQIKGIGPKMETLCNSLGFYHFDQIAGWTPDEVAWVDANLEGFKGRVTRDTWVEQAKILAAGGETAFSKKVEKGGVYDT